MKLLLSFPILLLMQSGTSKMPRAFDPTLQRYVNERVLTAMDSIPAERRESLDLIAAFINERNAAGAVANITFICTHNSRRSHMAQLWASAAAWHFNQDRVRSFSGGTEATAFNPRAMAAVQRAGFTVVKPEGQNPRCVVSFSKEHPPELCWSKVYDDPSNPQKDFCAVMTCSQADAACPSVRGALDRISLPYDDPKVSDGTPEEAQRYDERCLQIAVEMFYVFSHVRP